MDIFVEPAESLTLETLAGLHATIAREYPQKKERKRFEARFSFAEPAQHTTTQPVTEGYLFQSTDGVDAVQFRMDGFTLNRLKPYPGWAAWLTRFDNLWELYRSAVKPRRITRIDARCINVIPLDSEKRITDYLVNSPVPPPVAGAELRAFIQRLELEVGNGRHLNIVQLVQQGEGQSASNLQLVLDIDAYSIGEFASGTLRDELELLHDLRNQSFFQSLTESAIRSFE